MEIVCEGCGSRYRIADDKIPRNRSVTVVCKKCSERIVVEPREEECQPPVCSCAPFPGLEREIATECFAPDASTAILYSSDFQTLVQMEKGLSDLGYEVRIVQGGEDFAVRMRHHAYDLVLLHQAGADPDGPLKSILSAASILPAETRRSCLMALVHVGGSRYDHLKAFLHGVDLTLSTFELADLGVILSEARERKSARYRVFNECHRKVEMNLSGIES